MSTANHIIQNGIPKCGNLWLYNILQRLQAAAGVPKKSYILDHPVHPGLKQMDLDIDYIADIDVIDIKAKRSYVTVRQTFCEPILDLAAYAQRCSLVWSHSPWEPEMSPEVYRQFDKFVYIIRDPRDAMVSKSHFAFTPYRQAMFPHNFKDTSDWLNQRLDHVMRQWFQHVNDHLVHGQQLGMYVIFYERLLLNLEEEISKLAQYLGFELKAEVIADIAEQVTAKNMKKAAQHHIRSHKLAGWRQSLTEAQVERVNDIARDLLTRLGYATTAAEFDPDHLPSVDLATYQAMTAPPPKQASLPRRVARNLRNLLK